MFNYMYIIIFSLAAPVQFMATVALLEYVQWWDHNPSYVMQGGSALPWWNVALCCHYTLWVLLYAAVRARVGGSVGGATHYIPKATCNADGAVIFASVESLDKVGQLNAGDAVTISPGPFGEVRGFTVVPISCPRVGIVLRSELNI
eukprot:gene10750-45291_t